MFAPFGMLLALPAPCPPGKGNENAISDRGEPMKDLKKRLYDGGRIAIARVVSHNGRA